MCKITVSFLKLPKEMTLATYLILALFLILSTCHSPVYPALAQNESCFCFTQCHVLSNLHVSDMSLPRRDCPPLTVS